MKKEKHKKHIALTLLYSLVVFCINFTALLISGAVVYLCVHLGLIREITESTPKAVQLLVFMVIVSSIIGFSLSVFTSKIPLMPVKRLIDRMNQLASGNFKVRLQFGAPIDTHPTFVELTDSFNKMAEELESTELLRSDFINNFSHEFKTPIVSIAGFAKLLKKGNLTKEQAAEYLDIIEAESLRLSQMATNVLHLTQVENQSILTDVTEYNLSEQLRSCLLLLIDKWERKNLDLKVEFGEYTISANEELLKQVWINLIDNAVKFSPKGGTVEVCVSKDEDGVSVSIINSGETIAPENRKKIFNKFYQADESHASEGNGIGLAIVKKVVELHRGTVTVRSENGITMFTVELPESN